ncbi:AI-2E family transporter [Embleya sp. NPDC050154]|uniref:AI-2E family transporter n=1 Tax=Embleya sp. NPDC050154 TaxID=3363988 RepID=UPI0037B03606
MDEEQRGMGRLGNIWPRRRSGAPAGGTAPDPGAGVDGAAPDAPPAAGADAAAPADPGKPGTAPTTSTDEPAPARVPAQVASAQPGSAAGASGPGPAAPAGDDTGTSVPVPADAKAPASASTSASTPASDSGSDSDSPTVEPWTGIGSRFGDPGRPLHRSSPFYIGFIGGLGLITAWFLAQAVMGIQHVLIIILISFFLAAGLNPFVERLERRGLPRRWAVCAVALGFVIVAAGFVTAIAQPLVEQTSNLINSIPDSLTELRNNERFRKLDEKYDIVTRAKDWAANAKTAENVAGGLWGFGKMVLTSVFDTLTVIVLTLYFLGALPSIKEHLYNLFPKSRRPRVRLLGDEILSGIGGYVNGALIVASCAGLSSFIFLMILGNDYALPLALVIAFTDLIPMIGATIGAAVVSLVVFFDSPGKALTCVIFFLAYQQFENYLIYPRVMNRAVNVPPAITVIAALVGGALLGVTGALLAIPIAAAVLLILREVVTPRQDQA